MKPIKAYIAGKVSGMPEKSVKDKFHRKAIELRRKGFQPINPVALIKILNNQRVAIGKEPWTDETHRNEIMRQCASFLCECEEIHLLPDWQQSEGATIERSIAQLLNIRIVYP